MTFLVFCPRCMWDAPKEKGGNSDRTPQDDCGPCGGTGYIKASRERIARHLARDWE